MTEPVRTFVIVPSPGWRTLWSMLRGDVVLALMLCWRNWSFGFDIWRRGVAVCFGPLAFCVGHYPDGVSDAD